MRKIGVIIPAIPGGTKDFPVKVARMAADMGYHSVWLYEHISDRDPVVQLTQILERIPDIKVGFGCLNPFVRTPLTISMTAMTMEESYPGRLILGLGTGVLGWLDRAGVFTKLTHSGIREGVSIIRTLLRGETSNLSGRFFKVHDLKSWVRPAPNVKIFLSPRENLTFAEICGEIGDGCFGPIGVAGTAFKRLFEHIRIGLRRSGRTDADYLFANNFCAVADRTECEAKETIFSHPQFAHALGVAAGRESWEEGGLDPKLMEPYREAETAGDWRKAAKLVANTNAHTAFGICGERESVAEQIKKWVDLVGLDLPVLSICARNDRQLIETLAAGRMYAEQG
jgi:alkanesulfonate monooxygenase SsuD/methylene tetrahydromethanopterin reductase-like flavin-dependent oxidoreductase (luciferase family)